MVRNPDHEQRRKQIVDGVRAAARDHGLGQVTMARAAAAAGVSVGLVQHHWSSKDDLLIDTFTHLRGEVLARIDAEVARAERRGARIEEMLVAGLGQLLPTSPRRRDEVYLAHAFAGLALENDRLRAGLEAAQHELRERVATALSNGMVCGEVDPGVDVGIEAYRLLALTDGLAAHLLVRSGVADKARARSIVAAEVARLCPGECSHDRAGLRDRPSVRIDG
ncbi:TetR/AcrR family transcriptional regulator [Gordonia soli]|uniref:Putative TetR family transcriptional regulator n=1 Tax=Gordonia soli NBRC 108243 TaxID=1223545 RepID=M0QIP2_9ACTN|nr:TetR/AcrR family transcriptional regulator [Gordonia soli]GAC68403.1 putative TetR family transcriptional regulator [Gordonia soli NBRC 108243]